MRYGAPVAGSEKEALGGFLDHYRQIMLKLCEGLSEEQLRRPMTPTGTSLLGLVKHLAYVEQGWFQEAIAGAKIEYPQGLLDDPDADMRATDDETASRAEGRTARPECLRAVGYADHHGEGR